MKKIGLLVLLVLALLCGCVGGAGAECEHKNLGEIQTQTAIHAVTTEKHVTIITRFAECLDCGTVVTIDYDSSKNGWHSWVEGEYGKYCSVCGEEKSSLCYVCGHKLQGIGNITQYVLCDDNSDYHQGHGGPAKKCTNCGKIYPNFFMTGPIVPHNYDADGICTDCGHSGGCKHPNVKGRQLGEPTYEPLNPLRHTKITTMQDICEDCGAQIGADWQNSVTDPHVFAEGVCTLCGAEEATDSEYEPLSVLLNPWERLVNQGETVAVTPQISGGSGQYTVTARAESSDGQVIHGHTTLFGNSANTWVFYVTVEDMVTGEVVRAESSRIVVLGNCRHAQTQPVQPRVETVCLSTGEAERHGVYRKTTDIDQCDNCRQLVEREPVFELTGVEEHTFENGACKDCGQLSREAAAERYSIYIDSDEYYPAYDSVLLRGHLFGLQLEVYDAQEDKVINIKNHPELSFVMPMKDEHAVEMDEDYRIKIAEHSIGYLPVELQFCGEMIDELLVWDDYILENGDAAGTVVTLKELETHNWDDHGVWISNHLEIFDFDVDRIDTDATRLLDAATASDKEADFYRLKFDTVNWGASIYAVASFYEDQTEYDRVYVKSHWEEFSITNTLKYAWEGLKDYSDGRVGDTEMARKRTEVEIFVPAGGYILFLDSTDENVRFLNKVNYAARTLALSESYMSIFNLLEIEDKKAVADALTDADWDEIAVELTKQVLKVDAKILELSVDALIENPTFWRCLRDILVNEVLSGCWKKGEEVVVLAIDPMLYVIENSGDVVIQSIQHSGLLNMIEEGEKGNSHIDLKMVLTPQK